MRGGRRRATLLGFLLALAALALPAAAPASVPRDFYGVVSQESLTADDYRLLAEGHVATVRVPLIWASVQQVPGQCQAEPQVGICSWTLTDELVGHAAAAGSRIIPVLGGSPRFVSKNPKDPPIKGQDAVRWRAFLSAAAARYGPGGAFWDTYDQYLIPHPIVEWQIWNEQNGKLGWQGKPNARKYAKLLKISANEIRAQQPAADIVLGGMFGDAKAPLT
jgi:hypothetical protein